MGRELFIKKIVKIKYLDGKIKEKIFVFEKYFNTGIRLNPSDIYWQEFNIRFEAPHNFYWLI